MKRKNKKKRKKVTLSNLWLPFDLLSCDRREESGTGQGGREKKAKGSSVRTPKRLLYRVSLPSTLSTSKKAAKKQKTDEEEEKAEGEEEVVSKNDQKR